MNEQKVDQWEHYDTAYEWASNFFSQAKGNKLQVAVELWKLIQSQDERKRPVLFKAACTLFETMESSKSTSSPKEPELLNADSLKDVYGELVDAILAALIKRNLDENTFYEALWSQINDSLYFEGDDEKKFALYYILIDARIPYFYIDPRLFYSMSNTRYQELRRTYCETIQRIRFIHRTDFSQKTEQASTMLAEFGIEKPDEDKGSPDEIADYERSLIGMAELLTLSSLSGSSIRSIIDRLMS